MYIRARASEDGITLNPRSSSITNSLCALSESLKFFGLQLIRSPGLASYRVAVRTEEEIIDMKTFGSAKGPSLARAPFGQQRAGQGLTLLL